MIRSVLRLLAAVPRFRGKSRLAQTIGRVAGPTWIKSPYGPEIRFYSTDATSAYSAIGGGYDDVVDFIRELQPGMNFVDVGANAGLMSLIAAERIGSTGTCYAFEPNPFVLIRLAENIQHNQAYNVRILPFALSHNTGFLPIEIDTRHTGRTHMLLSEECKLSALSIDLRTAFPEIRRQISALPFFVKIDVEGFEAHVLSSISQLLDSSNCRAVILEVERAMLARAGSSFDEIRSFMVKKGYTPRNHDKQDHYNQVFERRE